MFTVTFSNGEEISWHRYENKPQIPESTLGSLPEKVVVETLSAKGEEHAFVVGSFQNIPSRGFATVWHGEMAQFIFNNL